MVRKKLLARVTIIGLILLNRWIFAAFFGSDYLLWYIDNGTFIGVGIAFISLTSKKFKNDLNAISADPLTYVATYIRYLAKHFMILSAELRLATGFVQPANQTNAKPEQKKSKLLLEPITTKAPATQEKIDDPASDESDSSDSSPGCLWGPMDSLLTMLWMLILFVALFLWIVVVVPPQYFVFLICGALPRYLSYAEYRTIERVDGIFELKFIKKSAKLPVDWEDTSLGIEPFTLTNLLSILFFAVVKFIVL
jgi:hypothetical protein